MAFRCKFHWREIAKRAVMTVFIVVLSPFLDLFLCILKTQKPMLIQTLHPEPGIERLDVGMRVSQAKRLKELEKENSRLKKLVADLSLDNAILKETNRGNF
jgi:hypothetical protein